MKVNSLQEDDYGTKKCQTMILIPKSDKKTVKAIQKAIDVAHQAKFGKPANAKSSKNKYPLKDGDVELENENVEGECYEDHYYINCTGYKIPGLVDKTGERIEDPDEREEICVSGNYFRFSITLKGYENDKNKGVRAILNNLMFTNEGERLDGSMKAEDEFAEFAEADDDDVIDFDDDEDEKPRRKKRSGSRRNRRRK